MSTIFGNEYHFFIYSAGLRFNFDKYNNMNIKRILIDLIKKKKKKLESCYYQLCQKYIFIPIFTLKDILNLTTYNYIMISFEILF